MFNKKWKAKTLAIHIIRKVQSSDFKNRKDVQWIEQNIINSGHVLDIFFRKDFTYRYTKNKLGKSYHKLVRDVCRKNKLESNIERFFNLIEKRKIKKRIDSVKKRHEQLSLTQDGTWTEEK